MVGGGWYLICFIIKNNLSIMIHLITSSMSWARHWFYTILSHNQSIEKHSSGLKAVSIITILRTLLQK